MPNAFRKLMVLASVISTMILLVVYFPNPHRSRLEEINRQAFRLAHHHQFDKAMELYPEAVRLRRYLRGSRIEAYDRFWEDVRYGMEQRARLLELAARSAAAEAEAEAGPADAEPAGVPDSASETTS